MTYLQHRTSHGNKRHAPPPPQPTIDELVARQLVKRRLTPPPVCTDEVFVRRAFLDVTGTLPTAQDVRAFLADKSPTKRSALIDRLLDAPEFAHYWAMKWSDILRVKSEFPVNLWPLAAHNYHRWIRNAIRDNWSYDRFVRTLLTASGSNFRDPEVNFYRAAPSKDPETIAKAVALTFMGTRAEKWPKPKLAAFAKSFSQVAFKATGEWKEEIVYPKLLEEPGSLIFPDGKKGVVPPAGDPREVFADWLIAADNSWFARNAVNRVWSWLMGRGIIHEPDDIRPDNPPADPELLAFLERSLVRAKYDLKAVYRLILNSRTYQGQVGPSRDYAHYGLRRLDAEVLIDAIDQITGTTETYSSQTPEPFTFIPEEQRSISLADGSITSSFLEMFGRPSRDAGYESERNNRPTAAQSLHLLNSSHIQKKIEDGPKLQALIDAAKTPAELVDELYLTILSRLPTGGERAIALDHIKSAADSQSGAVDIAWAALNSSEFLYRH